MNDKEIRQYLDKCNIERLTEDQRKILNDPISEEEIKKAINGLKVSKSPGPDGFTSRFYRAFKEELTKHLLDLFNKILKGGQILETWQQAIISLIPKKENQCPNIKNFRPISLLNQDYKIFTKILSERFKKILIEIISKDQSGFLPNRYIRDNVRTVIDMIELGDKVPGLKMGMFFMDAEKTFDNIEWNFIKITLQKMEIGECFLNAIENIYLIQKAKIRVNDEYTEDVEIQKGTRQGCPLSPLIFITVIDVLLKKIKKRGL